METSKPFVPPRVLDGDGCHGHPQHGILAYVLSYTTILSHPTSIPTCQGNNCALFTIDLWTESHLSMALHSDLATWTPWKHPLVPQCVLPEKWQPGNTLLLLYCSSGGPCINFKLPFPHLSSTFYIPCLVLGSLDIMMDQTEILPFRGIKSSHWLRQPCSICRYS